MPRSRARIAPFVAVFEAILLLAHGFVYETWIFMWRVSDHEVLAGLRIGMALLAMSFVAATLLNYWHANYVVGLFYKLAATWLGIFTYLFLAAGGSWVAYGAAEAFGWRGGRTAIAAVFFGAALATSVYGLINARWVRVKRVTVRLAGLPESWRGREAALVTDVHLGAVNAEGFMRRIVGKLRELRPEVVFIAGDLYDGSKVDVERVVAPWKELTVPFGAYFVTGNHEEFSNPKKFLDAVTSAGVRVLGSEMARLDGLQIAGANYHDTTEARHFADVLAKMGLERGRASILLSHVPHALEVAERAGVGLQVSGHTHGGQMFPFTWMTQRIFQEYTYGLQQFGAMAIYTSSGAGTWGPPLRVGTRPEIVMIRLEMA